MALTHLTVERLNAAPADLQGAGTGRAIAQQRGRVPFSAGIQRPRAALPSGACDSHIHFYDSRYPAAAGARLLPPDAAVRDYRELQHRIGTRRAVVVTPSTYGCDNRCMLAALAELGPDARGVAVLDGTEGSGELARLHRLGVRGARLNLSLGVTGSVELLEPLAQAIAAHGWHLQLLMPPELLATLGKVLRTLPVQLVFDHFGRIPAAQVGMHPAHSLVLELLEEGRAWIKLSGGYLLSSHQSVEDPALDALARSYLDAAPDRVVWGSDWPHATASAGHQPMPDDARQIDRLREWTGSEELFRRVLVDNAQSLYGFPAALPSC